MEKLGEEGRNEVKEKKGLWREKKGELRK